MSLLHFESRGAFLIPLAMNCDNMSKISTRTRHQGLKPVVSSSGGRDQEDGCLKLAQANSSSRSYLEKLFTKNRAGEVAQVEGLVFEPQCYKKKNVCQEKPAETWYPEFY
jgi:hypothetical protein